MCLPQEFAIRTLIACCVTTLSMGLLQRLPLSGQGTLTFTYTWSDTQFPLFFKKKWENQAAWSWTSNLFLCYMTVGWNEHRHDFRDWINNSTLATRSDSSETTPRSSWLQALSSSNSRLSLAIRKSSSVERLSQSSPPGESPGRKKKKKKKTEGFHKSDGFAWEGLRFGPQNQWKS